MALMYLGYLVAVAEEVHITRAAERLEYLATFKLLQRSAFCVLRFAFC